jgi:poly(A) polymerase
MVSAIRFSARFNFSIDLETQEAIRANADTLFPSVAIERVWQEWGKMAKFPNFDKAIIEMHRLGLLPVILPELQGQHLNAIKLAVGHFKFFPTETPPVFYLLELFPKFNLENVYDICKYFKMSNEDLKLAELMIHCRQLIQRETEGEAISQVQWTYFYAQPHAMLSLQVIAARLSDAEKEEFCNTHTLRQKNLRKHIERIQTKAPLVNAALLQHCGIKPGKLMGSLLREAEAIAIMNNFDEAEQVLHVLKEKAIWPNQQEIKH